MEADQRIQYCINGRDLSQIKGTSRNSRGKKITEKTEARFPNLLNQYRTAIAEAALLKAKDNYNKKWSDLYTKAVADRDIDVKEYACNMLPSGSGTNGVSEQKPLVTPYSIVYDVKGIISAENLILDDNNVTQQNVTTATDTNTVDNTIVNNVVSNTVLDNTTAKPQVNEVENTLAPTTTVTTNYNTSSNTLSIGNILSILLIVVGFLLLLLGIAILIRMKR